MAESQYTPLTQAGGSRAASYNMVPGLAGAGWSNIASGSFPSTNTTGMPTWQPSSSLLGESKGSTNLFSGIADALGFSSGNGIAESFRGGRSLADLSTTDFNKYLQLSAVDKMNQSPGLLDMAGTVMQGINMFKQWDAQDQYMDMMREQLGMAREQWNMTKDEVSRIAQVRNNLNSGYQSGNYEASPTSKTYA